MTLSVVFGHLSYLLTTAAFLAKGILPLRTLAIVASLCGIGYALLWVDGVLWVDLMWETGFVVINAFHVVILMRERREFELTEDEEELYSTVFRKMSKASFHKLIMRAHWTHYAEGDTLTREGEPVERITLIYRGMAEARSSGGVVAYCKNGTMVGEMSFLSNEPASATVRALEETRCVEWRQDALQELVHSDELVASGMQLVFNENFIRKLKSGLRESAS